MQGGGVSSNSTTTSSTTTTNNGGLSEIPTLQDLQNHLQTSHFDPTGHEDFLDQMLSSLPAWAELQSPSPNPNKSPWDLNAQNANQSNIHFNRARDLLESQSISNPHDGGLGYQQHDESVLLASRLRHHQISGGGGTQPQLMMGRGGGGGGMGRSPAGADSGGLPLPLSLSTGADPSNGEGLFNGLSRSQQFNHLQNGSISSPNFGSATGANQSGVGGNGGGGGAPPVRQRVRARRGQATDPHSIAERLRRERIAERMKGLQELVPNANKTDKASMLDEIIDYVKFLQLQVKVLSMSRLGGAAAVAPLVADISSEGGGDSLQVSGKGHGNNGVQTTPTNGSSSITEHQVAKLMEEDMGSAMQYLQGKGLCLMPISLATAISTATCNSRNPKISNPFFSSALDGPSSPSLSVLTVQSATMGNGIGEASIKDATSVSKP